MFFSTGTLQVIPELCIRKANSPELGAKRDMFTQDALAGKHALVCGASKGIGQACAEELARAGARLTLLARNEAGLQDSLNRLGGKPGRHLALVCDLSNLEQLKLRLATLTHDVDILVCNSGGPAPGPLLDAETSALEAAFTQHLLANLLLVQALAPHMRAQNFGRIINIISTSV
ncbi:MAG: SDR family NAD(P)-dependent oxidoreductase, partial [Proteobacteria bacterium]|nr:SDR family NAD(P)-dependent oxidoreductase [Pseudomonadota bacterium]